MDVRRKLPEFASIITRLTNPARSSSPLEVPAVGDQKPDNLALPSSFSCSGCLTGLEVHSSTLRDSRFFSDALRLCRRSIKRLPLVLGCAVAIRLHEGACRILLCIELRLNGRFCEDA